MTTAISDTGVQLADGSVISSLLRNYIAGLTLSTAGASTTMSVAAGQAASSTNLFLINLLNTISKTTAAWAVGTAAGGLDTGTIRNTALGATCSFATNVMTCTVIPTSGTFVVGQEVQAAGVAPGTTIASLGTGTGGLGTYNLSTSPGTVAAELTMGLSWYYWYLIRRPDTGVVDVVFSASSSAPTLPANYTQYRYIGASLTNGSSQWASFLQFGDDFYWGTIVNDVNATLTTTAANFSLSVPRKKVKALMQAYATAAAATFGVRVFDPALADAALSATGSYLNSLQTTTGGATTRIATQVVCYTSAAAQIRAVADSSVTFQIGTLGWTDDRGKNA